MTIDVPSESPQGNVLNYSIVTSDEEQENPLVLKLKLSENNANPIVVLKKLEDANHYQVSPQASNRRRKVKKMDDFQTISPQSPRKRNLSQKTEDKCSPTKIRKSQHVLEEIDDLCSSIAERVKLRTPVKRASTLADTNKGSPNITNTPRRRSSRILSPMCEGKKRFSNAELVKTNLNESFRRTVLKSTLETENIMVTPKSNRSARKSLYDSEEDEAIQVVEALKRSEMEVSFRKDSLSESISDDSEWASKTPRKQRPRLRRAQSTPKNVLKKLRDGTITPSMHSRQSIVQTDRTPLMKARTQLHVSFVPTSLPCREKEYLDVYNFLRGKLEDGCGGCMYISGVPGTGKTATVTSVINNLVNAKDVQEFNYVTINGMRLTEPRQAYVEIWKQLTGKTVPWEQAQSLLEERFTKKTKSSPTVMLIDELDILCTKRQDVVYNLLDWPTKCKDQLIVVTIANTMDLPERLLMSRVTSRLGLTRLTFQAYSHKQLMEIVTKRLAGINSFNSDAVQLVARKVASVSGDARRALDICRRAAEVAEDEGKGQMVGIMHVNEALNAMITQPQVTAIRRCTRLQKLLLQAIVAEIERTGVEETTFADAHKKLVSCCALDGFKMVSATTAKRALYEMSARKLLLTDQNCSDTYQRIVLNVSVHDVYFALKKDY